MRKPNEIPGIIRGANEDHRLLALLHQGVLHPVAVKLQVFSPSFPRVREISRIPDVCETTTCTRHG